MLEGTNTCAHISFRDWSNRLCKEGTYVCTKNVGIYIHTKVELYLFTIWTHPKKDLAARQQTFDSSLNLIQEAIFFIRHYRNWYDNLRPLVSLWRGLEFDRPFYPASLFFFIKLSGDWEKRLTWKPFGIVVNITSLFFIWFIGCFRIKWKKWNANTHFRHWNTQIGELWRMSLFRFW